MKQITKELAEKMTIKLQQAIEYYEELERLAEEHQKQLQETSYDERNAEPCAFCQPDNELAELDADLGELGKMTAGMNLYCSEDRNGKTHAMLSIFWECKNRDGYGESLGEKDIEIRYCPFCGRRL